MIRVVALSFVLLLAGCAQPAYQAEPPRTAILTSAPGSCKESLAYQTAAAHPEIRWVAASGGGSTDATLSCLLAGDHDDGSIEMKAYMSSGLYEFVRECGSDANTTHRLFRYRNEGRPYALRLHRDPNLDPVTWVIISSYRKPAGNFQHEVGQRGNKGSDMSLCPPAAAR